MSEFTPITTQEQLDGIIGERIRRARETAEKSFAGFLSPEDHVKAISDLENKMKASIETANNTIATQKNTIEELTGKVKTYEADAVKIRIASKFGIPMEMRDRLRGETEEEITKDAESFSAIFKHPAPPLAGENPPAKDDKNAAMKQLAASLTQKYK